MTKYDFNKNDLINFEEGYYDDCFTVGFYQCICDLNLKELSEKWIEEQQPFQNDSDEQEYKGFGEHQAFICWLIDNKYITSLKYRTAHLGGYGRFNLS